MLSWEYNDDGILSTTNTIYDDMKIYNKEEKLVVKIKFISQIWLTDILGVLNVYQEIVLSNFQQFTKQLKINHHIFIPAT